jgi:hypothetical protein
MVLELSLGRHGTLVWRPYRHGVHPAGVRSVGSARYLTTWTPNSVCYNCWTPYGHQECPRVNVREICYLAYVNHPTAVTAAIAPFLPKPTQCPTDFDSFFACMSTPLVPSDRPKRVVYVKDLVFAWAVHYRRALEVHDLLISVEPTASVIL